MTTIQPTKNLYNKGKCFSKGKTYIIPQDVNTTPGLTDIMLENDMGELHIIGTWRKHFIITTKPKI